MFTSHNLVRTPSVIYLRSLVTAPWLPSTSNQITEDWTLTLKHKCWDNTITASSWTDAAAAV